MNLKLNIAINVHFVIFIAKLTTFILFLCKCYIFLGKCIVTEKIKTAYLIFINRVNMLFGTGYNNAQVILKIFYYHLPDF